MSSLLFLLRVAEERAFHAERAFFMNPSREALVELGFARMFTSALVIPVPRVVRKMRFFSDGRIRRAFALLDLDHRISRPCGTLAHS